MWLIHAFGVGIAALDNGDFDLAILNFDQAIRIDPNYALAYRNRSLAYAEKGDFDRAIEDFEAALLLDPNHADARSSLAQAQQYQDSQTPSQASAVPQAVQVQPQAQAQQAAPQQAPVKYALVIGNGDYSGISRLRNSVNDANDMTDALQSLGFTVDKVLDGDLNQMESAIIRLRNRLSTSNNAYGFFFYAGHGVQSNGINYLLPVNANIPSENNLRERAVSV